jgi:hypothetical protein
MIGQEISIEVSQQLSVFIKRNDSLLELTLSNIRVLPEHMLPVLTAISDNQKLQKINISGINLLKNSNYADTGFTVEVKRNRLKTKNV